MFNAPDLQFDKEEFFSPVPDLARWVRQLPQSAGSDSDTTTLDAPGLETSVSLNLRGLGAGRTLVLLDGQRLGRMPFANPQNAEHFVDLRQIPAAALQRISIRTLAASDGGATDAVAGQVSFQTRRGFSGQEASYDKNHIDGIGDRENLGLVFGFSDDHQDALLAFEAGRQSALDAQKRSWAAAGICRPPESLMLEENCSFLDRSALVNALDYSRIYGRYSREVERNQGTARQDISVLVANSSGQIDIPGERAFAAATSPLIPEDNPGRQDLLERGQDPDTAALFVFSGPQDRAQQKQQVRRMSFQRMNIDDKRGLFYGLDGMVVLFDAERTAPLVDSDRLKLALAGYGGNGCDLSGVLQGDATAGQQGCEYYNPYLTGHAEWAGRPNPLLYDADGTALYSEQQLAALINDRSLRDWLTESLSQTRKSRQADLRLRLGTTSRMQADGKEGWEVGMTWRDESWQSHFPRTAATSGRRFSRGIFGSWKLAFDDSWLLHLSLSTEDYGSPVGDFVLPGLSLQWQSGGFSARLDHASSVRPAEISQLVGSGPVLTGACGRELLLPVLPNPKLVPEEADRDSLSLQVAGKTFSLRATGWRIALQNPLLRALPDCDEPLSLQQIQGRKLDASGTELYLDYRFGTDAVAGHLGAGLSQLDTQVLEADVPSVSTQVPMDSRNIRLKFVFSGRHHLRLQQSSRTDHPGAADWQSSDLEYFYRYKDGRTRLYLSIENLTDETPGTLATRAGYDSRHHSPLGRTIKIGLHHHFQ